VAEQQRYSDEEAEQILRLAARSEIGDVSQDRLLAMAGELGISPEQVASAERDYREKREAERGQKESEAGARRMLWSHVTVYVAVLAWLASMDFIPHGTQDWWYWPLFVWSIILASQFANVFWPGLNSGARTKAWAALNEGQRQILGEIVRAYPQQKLQAISEVRNRLGLGLREAMDAVDHYESIRSLR
jgi:cation transport ATPase